MSECEAKPGANIGIFLLEIEINVCLNIGLGQMQPCHPSDSSPSRPILMSAFYGVGTNRQTTGERPAACGVPKQAPRRSPTPEGQPSAGR